MEWPGLRAGPRTIGRSSPPSVTPPTNAGGGQRRLPYISLSPTGTRQRGAQAFHCVAMEILITAAHRRSSRRRDSVLSSSAQIPQRRRVTERARLLRGRPGNAAPPACRSRKSKSKIENELAAESDAAATEKIAALTGTRANACRILQGLSPPTPCALLNQSFPQSWPANLFPALHQRSADELGKRQQAIDFPGEFSR